MILGDIGKKIEFCIPSSNGVKWKQHEYMQKHAYGTKRGEKSPETCRNRGEDF